MIRAYQDTDYGLLKELYAKAVSIFKKRGHTQILVYSPTDDEVLANRYKNLDLQKGGNYTAYWADI